MQSKVQLWQRVPYIVNMFQPANSCWYSSFISPSRTKCKLWGIWCDTTAATFFPFLKLWVACFSSRVLFAAMISSKNHDLGSFGFGVLLWFIIVLLWSFHHVQNHLWAEFMYIACLTPCGHATHFASESARSIPPCTWRGRHDYSTTVSGTIQLISHFIAQFAQLLSLTIIAFTHPFIVIIFWRYNSPSSISTRWLWSSHDASPLSIDVAFTQCGYTKGSEL